MSDEIQKFDLSQAAGQLREKIRLAFVELIPPEQWEAMVKAELDGFLKARKNPNAGHYSVPTTLPSVFSSVAEEVYRAHVKALVKSELAKLEWNQGWDGAQEIGTQVKSWLTENAQSLLQVTLKEMFGYAAQAAIDRLRNT